MEYLDLYKEELANDETQYFIFDTSGAEGVMGDIDYKEYRWETDKFNRVKEGDLFIYRRQSKASEIKGQFYFFGTGKIGKIDKEGAIKVCAKIVKPYPFKNILLKDDLNQYHWHFKHRGKTWEHFFNQYGMNKIHKADFINLLKQQDDSYEQEDINLEIEFYQKILKGDYYVEDKKGTVKTRGAAQKAFSDQVKKCYSYKCAITGITKREFLVASHIIPWSDSKEDRLNPRNGICLSSLVDKAFDKGYITFSNDYRLIISEKVKSDEILYNILVQYEGKKLNIKKEFAPEKRCLQWHREHIFKKH